MNTNKNRPIKFRVWDLELGKYVDFNLAILDFNLQQLQKYVFEQWKGRYSAPPEITSFPSDGYDGLVTECNIPLTSMCSHHHESILGRVHISYIPGEGGRVIGLSKLNRIVEHFGRRGSIQEQLTMAIHQTVS